MREIKFRGKATVPHEDMGWVYGSLVIGPVFNSIHFTTNKGPQSVLVDWIGIGQYTGLKDKNGVKIYEGDVVDVVPILGIHFRGVVKFSSHTCAFDVFREERGDSACLKDDFSVEVRGNVFDDPVLKKRYGDIYFNEEENHE